jgi:hypothetical protein
MYVIGSSRGFSLRKLLQACLRIILLVQLIVQGAVESETTNKVVAIVRPHINCT